MRQSCQKYFLILFLIVPLSANALWKGWPTPQAESLRFNPGNSNYLYVIANVPKNFDSNGARRIAYESIDSGQTFQEISLSSIPPNYTITNVCNTIQYALGPDAASAKSQLLWRSNDGGITWHKTKYKEYIDQLQTEHIQRVMQSLNNKLPTKHHHYYVLFLILSFGYFIIMLFYAKRIGWYRLIISLLKSGLLIVLFLIVIFWFDKLRHILVRIPPEMITFPVRIFINIAMRPIALIIGFFTFCFTLPATIDILRYRNGKWNPQDNLKIIIWEGIAIVLWIFIGHTFIQSMTLTI